MNEDELIIGRNNMTPEIKKTDKELPLSVSRFQLS